MRIENEEQYDAAVAEIDRLIDANVPEDDPRLAELSDAVSAADAAFEDADEDVVELTDVERDVILNALADEGITPNAALIEAAELRRKLIDQD